MESRDIATKEKIAEGMLRVALKWEGNLRILGALESYLFRRHLQLLTLGGH